MKQEKTHEIRENLRFKLTSCSLRSPLGLVVADAGFHLLPPRSTQFRTLLCAQTASPASPERELSARDE